MLYLSDVADVVEPIDDDFDAGDYPTVESLEELKESTEDAVLEVECLINDLGEWVSDAEALISKIEEAIEDREDAGSPAEPAKAPAEAVVP
jgi:hypothetical protein